MSKTPEEIEADIKAYKAARHAACMREYRVNHGEELRAHEKEYHRLWVIKNRDKVRAYQRERYRKQKEAKARESGVEPK